MFKYSLTKERIGYVNIIQKIRGDNMEEYKDQLIIAQKIADLLGGCTVIEGIGTLELVKHGIITSYFLR